MNKCAVSIYRGDLGLDEGPPDQQLIALPLSYLTTNIVTNNTT